jgi:hypothetical protein
LPDDGATGGPASSAWASIKTTIDGASNHQAFDRCPAVRNVVRVYRVFDFYIAHASDPPYHLTEAINSRTFAARRQQIMPTTPPARTIE